MLIFINKNKGYKSNKGDTSNKVDHIFEGSFHDVQEEIDDVEDFIKEKGENLMYKVDSWFMIDPKIGL